MKYTLKNGVFYDTNDNSASIEYFGSDEEAIKALDSLVDCYGCTNCYDCYGCVDCTNCSDCCYCRNRSDCSDYCYNKITPAKPSKIKNLHQKVLASASRENALHMGDWECGAAMCHAGWIVHHGGKTGQKLLEKTNYCFAAMQIAKASGIPVNPSMFFVDNEQGMKNIKMLNEMENKDG